MIRQCQAFSRRGLADEDRRAAIPGIDLLLEIDGLPEADLSFDVLSSNFVLKSGDGVCIFILNLSCPANAPFDINSLVSATITLPVTVCENICSKILILLLNMLIFSLKKVAFYHFLSTN